MADIKAIAEQLMNLTLLEANELKNVLEADYGITAAAPVAMGMMPAAAGAAAEEAEEQTEFDVQIKEIGPKKINVIKEVRALTGLGLKEAKEVVDNLGKVMEAVSKEAANEAKAKLEGAGAVIEVK